MGFGDVVGKILTSAGLGQEELVEVTKGCLSRINRIRTTISKEEREAIAFTLHTMIDELRHRDVATNKTAEDMQKVVQAWLG